MIKAMLLLPLAASIALASTAASAQLTAAQAQGDAAGYWRGSAPSVMPVRPGADCQELIAGKDGFFAVQPGQNRSTALGGIAADVYLGPQPQDVRNSVTVSHYDIGCVHGR